MKLLTLFQAHDFIASWARERNIAVAPVVRIIHAGDQAEVVIDATKSRLARFELADLRLNVEARYPGSPVAQDSESTILYASVHVPNQYGRRLFFLIYHPYCDIIRHSRKVRYIVLVCDPINGTPHYGFRYVSTFEEAIWKCRPEAIASVKCKLLDHNPLSRMYADGAKLLFQKFADGFLHCSLDAEHSKIFQSINIEKNSKY